MFNTMHMHVMFRLVGGDASPPSPPLNPPLVCTTHIGGIVEIKRTIDSTMPFANSFFDCIFHAMPFFNQGLLGLGCHNSHYIVVLNIKEKN